MNFHLKSDRYERKKVPILKGITLVFVCFVLVQTIAPNFLPGFFHRTVAPLWTSKTEDKTQQIAELQAKIASHALVETEYNALLADLGARPPAEVLFAHVLVLPPQSLYDTLIIDAGAEQGVRQGKKVFAGHQILIGEIIEVQAKTAKAKLFSSPNQKYDVIIGSASSSVRATATGRGGGMYEVLVPRESRVAVGDLVTVPEISTIAYGKVDHIITDPARAFDSVLFQSSIPIQSLRHVYIEK